MPDQDSKRRPDWIAVDWGTSRLRVWAMTANGTVLAARQSEDGMSTLSSADYERVLTALVSDFLPVAEGAPMPVVVCGMAGARGGWREAGYRTVPCTLGDVGDLTRVPCRDPRLSVTILPGLRQKDAPDVMRGEETAIAGLISAENLRDGVACLPGTHSKWCRIDRGGIAEFTTVMTGELFAAIAGHTILRLSLSEGAFSETAFREGVDEGLQHPETLTARLFGLRANDLLSWVGPGVAVSRLSGLLVGAELSATRSYWADGAVHLVASDPLAEKYALAFEVAGAEFIRENAEKLTLAGLGAVYRALLEDAA
ncbi:2-dehydro-3-deoxygalactonokinase [Rhodospirillaceae bacterium KN72]|uniref:2-dehydro-3-deoxygalactonokinase n=1 Tax=Pacificispira spongiicola TaxID=2729598 RepID=A0A7Y0HDH7_9PROT|nr:2-dehydro-3-deoxygalactonokinase [Pacificispira spongiicola]NMM43670.1 2-dehydro-3-deoxygalactonokinase [Pacificispira spongiicola]